MEPWDDRGQSIQIGAVLIFGALILLLSLYQATVVPEQNEQVEFDHSQQVQGELLDLRNAVVSTVGDAGRQSVSIQLGTTYPPRFLAVNPPPVSGQLRTVETADGDIAFGVTNATALDGETDDFWDGGRLDYDTGGVVYRPNYNEYGQPPSTVYENSVLYDDFSFEGTTIARSDQGLVDGSTLTLVALNGSLGRSSSGSTAVDVRPVSASTTTVAVTNRDPNSNVTLRVPTQLSESTWEDLLAAEFVDAGGNVTDLRTKSIAGHPDYRMLVVDLVPGTYELRMAKAGVGTRVTDTSAAYVTEISGNGSSVPEGSTGQFVVEVRDRYNNPVSGVTVEAATDGVGSVTAARETGDDGRAVFTFRAPANVDGAPVEGRVNASFAVTPGSGLPSFAGGAPENVSMNVTVRNSDGSGLGGGGGGGGAGYSLQWTPATTVPGTTSGGEACTSTPDPCNVTMQSETSQPQIGAPVGFGSNDTSVARVFERFTATDSDGTAQTTVRFERAEGNATLWTQSAGVNDTRLIATPSYASFESSLEKYGVFGTFQGTDSDKLTTQNANTGSRSALIDGGNDGGIVTTEYNTTGAELVVVQYWAQDSGAEKDDENTGEDEDLAVEYKTAAGTWVRADLLAAKGSADSPQNPTYHRTVRLGSDAIHGNFSLRFRQVAADSPNDEWLVDDPQITVVGKSLGGGQAGGRAPGGGGGNAAPTAEAGPDETVQEGNSVGLDGTGSTDSDGSISGHAWTIASGPGSLSGANSATPTYDAPADVSGDQSVTVELEVTDDDGATDTDTLTITVEDTAGQADPGFPYEDVNQDGVYQSGTDIRLTKADVSGSYTAADGNGLVVPDSTGTIDAGTVDWQADGITVGVDVSGDQITFDAGNQALTVRGTTLQSLGAVDLRGASVDIDGTSVDNYRNGNGAGALSVVATSGAVTAQNAQLDSGQDITVDGDGVDLTGATADNYQNANGEGTLDVTAGSGTATVDSATLTSMNDINVTGTAVAATGVSIDNYGNGNGNQLPVRVTANGGDVTMPDATVYAANDITVSGGAVDVSRSTLDNDRNSNGGGTVDVAGTGTVTATGTTLYSLNDINVTGDGVDVSDATVDNYQNGNGNGLPVRIDGGTGAVTGTAADVDAADLIRVEGASVDLSDANLNNFQNSNGVGDIEVRATGGDLVLERIFMATNADLLAYGTDTAGDDLFVQDGEFYQDKTTGNSGVLQNVNDVDVNGSTARGKVQ